MTDDEPYTTEGLATACGVTVRTIHRWRKDPTFPKPIAERPRDDGGGHDWSFDAVRNWLDDRSEWDWAMDRAYAADRSEAKTEPKASSSDSPITSALSSESPAVRRAAAKAQASIEGLREAIAAEERRREARAEVSRLNAELKAARSRLRASKSTPVSAENRRWREAQAHRDEIRAWAQENGVGVLPHGTVSMKVVRLYDEAHQPS
jgi:predicted DNA-binding transcriptional regulator AlpA